MLPFLQLIRLPNLFTAFADVMLGFLFGHESLSPAGRFGWLLLASGLLYSAGMVLNDVFDLKQDLAERPQRPIPSGRVAKETATRLGLGMLVGGIACGFLAGRMDGEFMIRPGATACALAVCILAYDGLLKKTWLGPFAMGGCRSLNVLLGMSTVLPAPGVLGYTTGQWCVVLGIGLYVAGVTWFAKKEASVALASKSTVSASVTGGLLMGVLLMLIGFGFLAVLPRVGEFAAGTRQLHLPDSGWWLLIGWLATLILRRCVVAIADPSPSKVQAAVKVCILSLIVLDAAVCLAVRSPWWWSVALLLLLLPTLTLGRWIYST